MCILIGAAGCGKSVVIKKLKQKLKNKLLLIATTGKAASNLGSGAETIHSVIKLPIKKSQEKNLSNKINEGLKKMKAVSFLMIDEYSMLSRYSIYWIDKRLREIFGNDIIFGGIKIVLIGDLFQLPPVLAKPCYI